MTKPDVYGMLAEIFKLVAYFGALLLIPGILLGIVSWESDATLAIGLIVFGMLWSLVSGALYSIFQGFYDQHLHERYLEALQSAPKPIFCSHCGMQNAPTAQACALCRQPIGHVLPGEPEILKEDQKLTKGN